MKIKKLSIHGFKSFPDRTQFVFPPGTSAIVGPNGCGKSNVVDAIRWVVGEQNARHLRGKVMEDLIFTGSDSRKPIGMAEVTLTISNEEKNAPLSYANFTEIEIQRRLYRDGESEYYINKVQSRLKDIAELFSDTGIGKGAYSIIEQGQVGWLVTAKPEERRTIFEEAAGINKYKDKKDAAVRRLDSTKENLVRVNDIISEVKRQLNSLMRQAKKAERYKAVKDELKGLELHLAHCEYKRLKNEVSLAEKKMRALEDEETVKTGELAKLDVSLEEKNAEHVKIEGEFKRLKEELHSIDTSINTEEREEEKKRLRIDELKRTAQRLAVETEELKRETAEKKGEISALKTELERMEDVLKGKRENLKENERFFSALDSALTGKENERNAIEANSMALTARIADIRHGIENCLKEEESLFFKEINLKKEHAETLKAMEEKSALIAVRKDSITDFIKMKEKTLSEFTDFEETQKTLERESDAKSEILKNLKEGLAAKRARLKTLEELSLPEGSLQTVMGEIGNKGGAFHGVLADVIETTAGYEKAVEAALGEKLNCVIVETHDDGMRAIEYLKQGSKGRLSFIPMRELRQHSEDKEGLPKDAAPIRNNVSTKNGYAPLLDSLLNDTLIVDSFDKALDIWKQNGIKKTLVTRDGGVVDQRGIITGGDSNGSHFGILERKREIKELGAAIIEAEKNIAALEGEAKTLEFKTLEIKNFIENHRNASHNMEIEKINKQGEIHRLEGDLAIVKQRHEAASKELSLTVELLNGIKSKKAELLSERETLEKENDAKTSVITAFIKEMNSIRGKKDSLANSITELKISIASMEEGCGHIKNQSGEKLRLVEDIGKKVKAKAEEMRLSAIEAQEENASIEKHRTALIGLLAKKDGIKKSIILKEEEGNVNAALLRELSAGIKALNARISSIREEKNSAALKLKELNISLENLKERNIEKYASDVSGYLPEEATVGMELEEMEKRAGELRQRVMEFGEVSLSALEEYRDLETRHDFLTAQQTDLTKSIESLQSAISRINRTTRERFKASFDEINAKFAEVFPKLFNGGRAMLKFTGEDDLLECGIEIIAQPPGKKLQNINLLSGGEKALTATALIFSIFLIKPAPFCLLDEVDAPLDDVNVDRFNGFVKDMSAENQFMLITHNKRTMEMADTLFGITMEEPGVSKVVSVRL